MNTMELMKLQLTYDQDKFKPNDEIKHGYQVRIRKINTYTTDLWNMEVEMRVGFTATLSIMYEPHVHVTGTLLTFEDSLEQHELTFEHTHKQNRR